MILRRLGNKKKIAVKIQAHFPPHKIYIEPFFGAGGMFFNKPKAQFNMVNDLDSDVFNLFTVIMNRRHELDQIYKILPISSELFNYWKTTEELDPVKKALRFIYLSNFSLHGKGDTFRTILRSNDKLVYEKNIDETLYKLKDVKITGSDFREFFKNISFIDIDFGKPSGERESTFIYNDGPYLGTNDNYSSSFKEQDSFDLFEVNHNTGCKYAISEFNHPFIIEQAKERNLNIITIGERQNIKNRRTEILITNYENHPTLF